MPLVMATVWRPAMVILLARSVGLSQGMAGFTAYNGQMGAIVGSNGVPFRPVTGAPYSGSLVSERVQTLADGTHISETVQTTKVYRDSAGRTRTEHQMPLPPGATAVAQAPVFVDITDPVAGYRYTLEAQNHIARRMAWPPAGLMRTGSAGQSRPAISTNPPPTQPAGVTASQSPASPTATRRPRPDMTHESLGTQTIEGITAEGSRTTTIYPVGFMGNDRPITTVRETWMSPDLKVMVMSKTTDPRSGDQTTRLTNVSQTEPDPALFQVPADYTIEDAQPAVAR